MSKKVTYVLCVIMAMILAGLLVCEMQNPEGGMVMLQKLLQK